MLPPCRREDVDVAAPRLLDSSDLETPDVAGRVAGFFLSAAMQAERAEAESYQVAQGISQLGLPLQERCLVKKVLSGAKKGREKG